MRNPAGSEPPVAGGVPAASGTADVAWDLEELRAGDVGALLVLLDKTIRARRFYQANGPVYDGFVTNLRAAFAKQWGRTDSIAVAVEENGFTWQDERYAPGEGRETLAFLFYKDGIRQLVFLPGFEEEVERFIRVVDEARRIGAESGDDMVTLLWEQEFACFQYGYVEVLAEGVEVPDAGPRPEGAVDFDRLVAEIRDGDVESSVPPAVAAGQPTVAQQVAAADFSETLYFLDDEEVRALAREVEREESRDFKASVLAALFDRLDDGRPEWRLEVLGIFRQLLPVYLGRGDLDSAARIVTEVTAVARSAVEDAETVAEARSLLVELSGEAVLNQLMIALEEGSIDPGSDDLGVFLEHLGGDALPRLIAAAETTRAKALQERLRQAMESVAAAHPERLVECIAGDDPVVALGAARLAGAAKLTAAVPAIVRLARSPDPLARRAAVEALVDLRGGVALDAVVGALDDEDREVRVAAARGIATVRYHAARGALAELVGGRDLRDADLGERIAVFEAFGAVADARGVELLDGMLNGRRLLGKESPEARACAAIALGRVASPAAKVALERAAKDPNPVVRNAVVNALRGAPR